MQEQAIGVSKILQEAYSKGGGDASEHTEEEWPGRDTNDSE